MTAEPGQQVYARRRLIETVNGQLKNHGLARLMLRGLAKIRCEVLLHAIAHNIRRGHALRHAAARSEEHTSELQSLMRISYAVFCLKKKKNTTKVTLPHSTQTQN